MDITDVVSKGLNHLEVKYDGDQWVIKKQKSDESYEFVNKLIENNPIFIPRHQVHRVIKGETDLKIPIN